MTEMFRNFKIVRGVIGYDGKQYRRWIAAYPDGSIWRAYDCDEIVSDVDSVVSLDELDRLSSGPAETQTTISQWADETFGAAGSNARVAARANEEMAELMRALTVDDNHPKAVEEIADIVIVLSRLATRLGVDLQSEVERKMAINREREWKLDNTGHGYHVRNKESA